LSALVTERVFAAPSRAFATALAEAGGHASLFRLNWFPAGSTLGACHCIELPLVFGNPDAWQSAPMLAGATAEELRVLAADVQDLWIRFIRDGEAGPAEVAWPGRDKHPALAVRPVTALTSSTASHQLRDPFHG
jgi:para-nitrobenzyl esterase